MANYSGELRKEEHPVLILGELGLVNSLGETNVPLFLGTETERNIATYSRYVNKTFHFSRYDSEAFIEELCELGDYFNKKPVLFSDDDRALLNISQNREKLNRYYFFLFPKRQTVHDILDKESFTLLAEEHKLPVPASYKITSINDFEQLAARIKYPCIIKPAQRHFWWGDDFINKVGCYKKAFKCRDLYEFVEIWRKIARVNPNMVIQEYVRGKDKKHYSANLFVDEEGKLRGYYIAQKKRIYPINAGTGTYIETVDNPEVLKISLEIIEKLELRGLLNVQFKQDSQTGEYKLMEIHIRNSLWSLLGAKAGANLAQFYYQHLAYGLDNQQVVSGRQKVKYLNYFKDFRAMEAYRKKGELTMREWWQSIQGNRVAPFTLKDPLPLLFKVWFTMLGRTKRNIKNKLTMPKHEIPGKLGHSTNFLTKIF